MTAQAQEPVVKVAADGRINVVSPLDGRILQRIPSTPPESLPELVARARAAQAAWQAVPLDERAKRLKPLAKRLAGAGDAIVETLRTEIGRHPAESWFAEVVPNLDLIRWWTGKGRAHLRAVKVGLDPLSYPGKKARVDHVPRGVLGLITPWNYPVSIPLRSLVPGLLSGNAILWKPSEYAAMVASQLGELFDGLIPADLLTVVQGDGRVGAALIEQVDAVGFTGSLATGKRIAVRAAERLIPSSLELGGKDFAVVLPDADLKRAAAGIAWGGLSNAGQNCAAVEIVAVHEDVASRFSELLREEVRKMAPFVGPLVNEPQKRKVADQLGAAVAAGALAVEGGLAAAEGLRIEPTVLERVPADAAILCEETFGPVIPVTTFRSLDEIAERLERSDYGLTLSLWTKDVKAAEAWGRGRPVGVVTVNNHGFTAAIAAMPWTGVKGSGLGVTNGPHALEWMVRPQGVLIDRAKARELWWHPFNDAAVRLARGLAHLTTGAGPRFAALKAVLGGMLGRWK